VKADGEKVKAGVLKALPVQQSDDAAGVRGLNPKKSSTALSGAVERGTSSV